MVIIYDFKENNYQQLLFYQLLYMPTTFHNFMKQNLQNKKKTLDLELDLHETYLKLGSNLH
jgi:hypothetical protein